MHVLQELQAQIGMVTCPVSPAWQQQTPRVHELSGPCMVLSNKRSKPSENAGKARRPGGLEQGELTVEQPSDLGDWGPLH